MILNQPGSGWGRLANAVAQALPVEEIDAVWQFRTLRREGRELGTAILSRVDGERGERRRVYTARFVHVLTGKERGKFESALEEVGSGPAETIGELVAGVRRRLEDEDPRPVDPAAWFRLADGAPRQG
ncbi:MAG TPA: hypothetical protein VNK43_08520 [Gemmatimonadales bacterium]|nr:hypothetical protein [Gemmatimonadales bacterium]